MLASYPGSCAGAGFYPVWGAGGKPLNVACCVQCLYSTATIISSAKISSDVIVCSKKNRSHGTCHGEVLEAQE